MNFFERRIRRQPPFVHIDGNSGKRYAGEFRDALHGLVDPKKVETILDLFCGIGMLTSGALHWAKNCTVHAVDYHPVLAPILLAHPRVVFHQGMAVDVLAGGEVPPGDITVVSFADQAHGFSGDTIHLLRAATCGYLLLIGLNADIENTPGFLDNFAFVRRDEVRDTTVWVGK